MTTDRLDAPYALVRFRDGHTVALGLVAGDRVRRLSNEDLGASGLNAFLAAPDWERLRALAEADGEWMPLADVTRHLLPVLRTRAVTVRPRSLSRSSLNFVYDSPKPKGNAGLSLWASNHL